MRAVTVAGLALALGACGGGGGIDVATSGPGATASAPSVQERLPDRAMSDTVGAAAGTRMCSAPGAGYSIRYPDTWFTVEAGPVPCRFFHPEPFQLAPATEAPGLAVAVELAPVAFDDLVPSAAGTQTVKARRDAMVAGHRAVRLSGLTGEVGLLEPGLRRLTWFVEAGPATFIATTSEAAQAGTFASNSEVLDSMVSSLELAEPVSGGADQGHQADPR